MQAHSEIGAKILAPLSFLSDVATTVLHHHENHDGSGYPAGLAGDDIPQSSRIIHVADAYDAMTSHRPYRRGLSHQEALRRITEADGLQFDPASVATLLELARTGLLLQIRDEVDASAA